MTALPHVGAMAFFDANSLETSYGFAQRFAGKGGHIATLPEIISARAQQHERNYLWGSWFTSSSVEYFGLSKGGVPIIIVAHGVGPLMDLESITQAYQPTKFRDDGRPAGDGEGHISLEEFRRLEEGHYGDVTIVEVARVTEVYRHPFLSAATIAEAERDPLLQARLGPAWKSALYCMKGAGVRAEVKFTGPSSKVVRNEGPTAYWHEQSREGWPFAHLLSVGAASHVHGAHEDGGEYIGFDVDCHKRWHSKRFIGVRPGGDVENTHAGPAELKYHRGQFTLPNALPPEEASFFALKQFGTKWFTQAPKGGCALDTGVPEYPVSELEIVGHIGKIVALDETMFFRYHIDEVIQQAPPEANAYYVSAEPECTRVDGKDAITAEVVFCRVVLDSARKAPSEEALNGDYELQMRLLERLDEAESDT